MKHTVDNFFSFFFAIIKETFHVFTTEARLLSLSEEHASIKHHVV